VHEISSPYSFCYLIRNVQIGEITGLYFPWIVDKNSKNTSQFQLVTGSLIHLLAYCSLGCIHRVQWMTFLWRLWYYLTVSNGSKDSLHCHPLALWKPTSLPCGKYTNILSEHSGRVQNAVLIGVVLNATKVVQHQIGRTLKLLIFKHWKEFSYF